MTTPAELERKVRQLDNDVQSIYEMLATIEATQKRQGNRLAEIAARVGLTGRRTALSAPGDGAVAALACGAVFAESADPLRAAQGYLQAQRPTQLA